MDCDCEMYSYANGRIEYLEHEEGLLDSEWSPKRPPCIGRYS